MEDPNKENETIMEQNIRYIKNELSAIQTELAIVNTELRRQLDLVTILENENSTLHSHIHDIQLKLNEQKLLNDFLLTGDYVVYEQETYGNKIKILVGYNFRSIVPENWSVCYPDYIFSNHEEYTEKYGIGLLKRATELILKSDYSISDLSLESVEEYMEHSSKYEYFVSMMGLTEENQYVNIIGDFYERYIHYRNLSKLIRE